MSRTSLLAMLGGRPGGRALAPLIGLHAARLEQVEPRLFLTDPEVQARALRNAQALYGTDAVTVGAWLGSPAAAAHRAAGGNGDLLAAPAALTAPPDVEAVLAQPVVRAEIEAIRRLRPVLGERAAVAVVLPSAGLLEQRLGGHRAWCAALLLRLVRLFGAEEPDLLMLAGDDPPAPRLEALCDHFGMRLLALGGTIPAGLLTTAIEPQADPREVRAALDQARQGD